MSFILSYLIYLCTKFDKNLFDFVPFQFFLKPLALMEETRRSFHFWHTSNFWYSKEYVTHMRTRAWGYSWSARKRRKAPFGFFSINLDLQTSHVLHPATGTQSRPRSACLTQNNSFGLWFNLKEHRVRRWLHCRVILVFIASRDWCRCRSGVGDCYVHPAMDIGVRLVRPALYTPSRIISRRVRARGHGIDKEKKKRHPRNIPTHCHRSFDISTARNVNNDHIYRDFLCTYSFVMELSKYAAISALSKHRGEKLLAIYFFPLRLSQHAHIIPL